MGTFKVYWKNGTNELLMGENIAEAFNSAGYTDKLYLEALIRYSIVTPIIKENSLDDLFSCALCCGQPIVTKHNDTKFTIACSDCDCGKHDLITFTDEIEAKQYWNKKQLALAGIH